MVDIQLLLAKLVYYGFDYDTVKWFSCYLSSRIQQVEVRSEAGFSILSGAATVARPVLFLYIADIVDSVR